MDGVEVWQLGNYLYLKCEGMDNDRLKIRDCVETTIHTWFVF